MSLARADVGGRKRMQETVIEAELHLLCREHTTETLAKALGVSLATAARVVVRLRRAITARGGELVSVRKGRTWHYEIREGERPAEHRASDPLVKAIGALRGAKRSAGEGVDDVVYNGK